MKQVGAFHFQDTLLGSVGLRAVTPPLRRPHSSMPKVLHAIQIGSLATWSGVAAVGFVGLWLGARSIPSALPPQEKPLLTQEIFIGAEPAAAPDDSGQSAPADPATSPAQDATAIPDAPELPAMADLPPLPDVPDLPEPPPAPAVTPQPEPSPAASTLAQRPSASRNLAPPRGSGSTTANSSRNIGNRSANSRSGAVGNGNAGNAGGNASDASRISGGRMPAPVYPSDARRLGQTGTVLVEFTVDTSGRVISARAKSSSSHASLDNEAVRTVRRWKFPPGPGIMKLERPITFNLH